MQCYGKLDDTQAGREMAAQPADHIDNAFSYFLCEDGQLFLVEAADVIRAANLFEQ
jgi:hypothetical protein